MAFYRTRVQSLPGLVTCSRYFFIWLWLLKMHNWWYPCYCSWHSCRCWSSCWGKHQRNESLATAWQQHCHRLKGNILKSLGHSLELACLKILFVDVVWTVSTGHLLWPNNQLSGIWSLWQWFYKPFACFYDCLKLGMVHNTAIYLIFLHGQFHWHNVSAKISTLGISWTLNTNIWFTDV